MAPSAPKGERSNEKVVQKFFEKRLDRKVAIANSKKKIFVIETEYPLPSAELILRQGISVEPLKRSGTQVVGRVDVLFKIGKSVYAGEIKDIGKKSFWYATKTLAYAAYLNWQDPREKIKPAMFIPKKGLKFEHQIIAAQLGIKLFVFTIKKQKVEKIEIIGDEPFWKTLD